MKTDSLSLKNLFVFEKRWVVPLYQRPYVWREEEQWAPLWDDVRTIAERRVAGQPARAHFLGAVVLEQLPTPASRIDARLVIDGQQRLTTLQLAIAALRDLCRTEGDDESVKWLLKLSENDEVQDPESEERFKVWPTNVDRPAYRIVADPRSADAPAQKLRAARAAGPSRIADAYGYFHDRFREWSDAEGDPLLRRRALRDTLRDSLYLVVIDLEKDDEAQIIFETLNARGTPLLPMDLVKNHLFHAAAGAGADLDRLYEKHWRELDERSDYWRADVRQGRLNRPRIDVFLQHYLTMRSGDEVPATHLFTVFKEQAETDTRSAEEQLRELIRHARVFAAFSSAPERSRKQLFFKRLTVLDTTTVYPFLLDLYAREEERGAALDAILGDLESYLVRRLVCQLTTKRYNQLFLALMNAVREGSEPPARTARAFLLAETSETSRWPDDDEFRKAWFSVPIYQAITRPRLRMLLEALEAATQSDLSEDIELRGNLSVEHLMPQSWETGGWPLPPRVGAFEATNRRESLLHTFGNLTLLKQKLNTIQSNRPWAEKRTLIRQHGVLALNRQLQDVEHWDEEAIEMRSLSLFEKATRIWPRPEPVV
ncbi:MAG: DUF262 domain-containing protein [Proteobacteria bacterium]|nr:MAG: DUF262 domain-containing protein [Pseudomonadota bacterium]